jgi:hypothetical protein
LSRLFRLRASETQYRLEVDRLKTDLQCDQVRFQQFDRELADLRFERNNTDPNSSDVRHRRLLSVLLLNEDLLFVRLESPRINRIERARIEGVERKTRLHRSSPSTRITGSHQSESGRPRRQFQW